MTNEGIDKEENDHEEFYLNLVHIHPDDSQTTTIFCIRKEYFDKLLKFLNNEGGPVAQAIIPAQDVESMLSAMPNTVLMYKG